MEKTVNQNFSKITNSYSNGIIVIDNASSFNIHRGGEDEILHIDPIVGTKVSSNSWTFEIVPIGNQDGTATATLKIKMSPQAPGI